MNYVGGPRCRNLSITCNFASSPSNCGNTHQRKYVLPLRDFPKLVAGIDVAAVVGFKRLPNKFEIVIE
jgi:hypothetical protein